MTDTTTTELVTVPAKETALQVFSADHGLDPYLHTIREELDKFLDAPPSLDTATGRKAYASMAHKIARSKVAIDNLGKDLVADLKELPKKVDAERKRWRDQLDQWRDEARSPLDEWEAAEEKRIAAHNEKITLIESFAAGEDEAGIPLTAQQLKDNLAFVKKVQLGEHWEEFESKAARAKDAAIEKLAGLIAAQEKYEAEQAELERLRKEQAEREQKEREERIAREAAELARREAEEKAKAERDAAAKREQAAREEAERKDREAKEAAERREREHHEALIKAKVDAEMERQRIEEEHKRKEEARLAEQRREAEEEARRQADKQHQAKVNRSAVKAMTDNGITEEVAKKVVILVAKGAIPAMKINY